MMNVKQMVTDMRNESAKIYRMMDYKKDQLSQLTIRLTGLQREVQELTDQYDGLKMAIDALELAYAEKSPAPADEPAPEPVAEAQTPPAEKRKFSRTPKKIGKFDPKGKKLGEYSSINQAAKAMGWTNNAVRKYIESTGKDKQIRLRGYYLEFLAA